MNTAIAAAMHAEFRLSLAYYQHAILPHYCRARGQRSRQRQQQYAFFISIDTLITWPLLLLVARARAITWA